MARRYFERVSHANIYLQFRIKPPEEISLCILNFLREKYDGLLTRMVDVGCGSGQSASLLASHFKTVEATDISESQIELAKQANTLSNVTYKVSPAEVIPVNDEQLQLVTASQAAHWFDLTKFYKEVDRVLVPHGVLAMYGYNLPRLHHEDKTDRLCQALDTFNKNVIEEYWGIGRHHLAKEYELLPLPYEDSKRVRSNELHTDLTDTTLANILGYMSTTSGYQNYKNCNGEDVAERALQSLRDEICSIIGTKKPDDEVRLQVRYPFFMILGRKPSRS